MRDVEKDRGRAGVDDVWAKVLGRLEAVEPTGEAARRLSGLRPIALTPTELRLEAPNRTALVSVTTHYLTALGEALAQLVGPRQVVLELAAGGQGELFPGLSRRHERRAPTGGVPLSPKYTFATFVIGASNQFAHAAARAVATQPGDHYNPLFLYGGVGLGKTHLVHAIGHQILERRPQARIAYLSCDVFMTDLIASLRRDRMDDFKRRFRQVDVLLLDDVQLLSGREGTQEEFFHTFNSLYERQRQIVLTSDKVPKDIPDLEERLRNRFEWGLIADIQAPDVETRVAILLKKAEIEGIGLSHDVALYLASAFTGNVRELEGSLTRVAAHASVERQPITVDYAKEILRVVVGPRRPPLTFEHISTTVCSHFSIRPSDLRSRRRSRHLVVPRQVAMYLCRQLMQASFPQIGELFGRDHSTVIHATAVVGRRRKVDPGFEATIEQLEAALRGA